jgi:hypothetical protein
MNRNTVAPMPQGVLALLRGNTARLVRTPVTRGYRMYHKTIKRELPRLWSVTQSIVSPNPPGSLTQTSEMTRQ